MFHLQESRKVRYTLRLANIDPMIPNSRQPPIPRQRLRFLQLRITLQRLHGFFSPSLVPCTQVDEQRPIVESRGRVLESQVAHDGEADALVRAGHGGNTGKLWHGIVRA